MQCPFLTSMPFHCPDKCISLPIKPGWMSINTGRCILSDFLHTNQMSPGFIKHIFNSTKVCHCLTLNMHPLSTICMQTLLLTGGIQAQVGGLAGEPGNHPKANPTTTSHTHTATFLRVHTPVPGSGPLSGCQCEPQELQSCSAVWSNKIWGFLSLSDAAQKTHTCTNGYTQMHTCTYIHIHEYTVHSCCELTNTTDVDFTMTDGVNFVHAC